MFLVFHEIFRLAVLINFVLIKKECKKIRLIFNINEVKQALIVFNKNISKI